MSDPGTVRTVWAHLEELQLPYFITREEGASLTHSLLAAVALLALARCAMSNDICTLAVGAVQDLEDHRVTRLRWGLLWLSYTPRE